MGKPKMEIPDNPDAHDVVVAFCQLREHVSNHFDWLYAADCICGEGGMGNMTHREGFRDDGFVYEFIRDAVLDRLAENGRGAEGDPHQPGLTPEGSRKVAEDNADV